MLCECFNYVLKHIIQQDRPSSESLHCLISAHDISYEHPARVIVADLGDGYGFPSSHSQWMGYFASFLFWHFTYRHRFASTGITIVDYARTVLLFTGIIGVSAAVAFSRCVACSSRTLFLQPIHLSSRIS